MCLPEEDVMFELDEVKNAPYSSEMHILKVHMAKGVITKSEFQCLQLYQIASYKELFNDQWYRRQDGSETYSHFDLPENFHPNKSCAKCFEVETECGWIQCPRCTQ